MPGKKFISIVNEVVSKIERMTSTYSTIDDAIHAQSEKIELLISIHRTYNSTEFTLERSIFIERQALIELKKIKEINLNTDLMPVKITWHAWIRKKFRFLF
jgi:hypothetical protein